MPKRKPAAPPLRAAELRAIANKLGHAGALDAAQLGAEVLEAASVVAGLCDAALDARRRDVERALEKARGALYDAAELLGVLTRPGR